jgi:LPS sulfotransferase NodH
VLLHADEECRQRASMLFSGVQKHWLVHCDPHRKPRPEREKLVTRRWKILWKSRGRVEVWGSTIMQHMLDSQVSKVMSRCSATTSTYVLRCKNIAFYCLNGKHAHCHATHIGRMGSLSVSISDKKSFNQKQRKSQKDAAWGERDGERRVVSQLVSNLGLTSTALCRQDWVV